MKRITYLMTLAAILCLFGCKPEENRVFDQTAGAGIAGTYTGKWSMVDDKNNASETVGTIVFSEIPGQAYQARLAIDASGIGYTGGCTVNVAHAGDDYVYYNNVAKELLPADAPADAVVPQIQGRVSKDGATSFSFKLKTGVGRFTKTSTYTFTGSR